MYNQLFSSILSKTRAFGLAGLFPPLVLGLACMSLVADAAATGAECEGRPNTAADDACREGEPQTLPWIGVEVLLTGDNCAADFAPGKAASALSIDGGGVRGIIPAAILAYVEARAGHPIAELFDIVSGVSTGSLIAVSLAHPGPDAKPDFTAAQIANDYLEDVARLFPENLVAKLESTAGIFRPRYDGDMLARLLRERLRDVHLSQLTTRVIVPTFDLLTNEALLFDSEQARSDASRDFLAWQVLRAASAYPSIYSPERIKSVDGKTELFAVDAALFSNSPEVLAEAEARQRWPDAHLVLLSLGTGIQATPVVDFDSDWGLADWIPGMLQVVSYGQSSLANLDAVRLLMHAQDPEETHYLRLNETLPHRSIDQFDPSPEHMQLLLRHAARVVATHKDRLDDVVLRLLCAKGL